MENVPDFISADELKEKYTKRFRTKDTSSLHPFSDKMSLAQWLECVKARMEYNVRVKDLAEHFDVKPMYMGREIRKWVARDNEDIDLFAE